MPRRALQWRHYRGACLIALLSAGACLREDESSTVFVPAVAERRMLRPVEGRTVQSRTVPTVRLLRPATITSASFRIVGDVTESSDAYLVLDRGRDPHVTMLTRSGFPSKYLIPNVIGTGDTIGPLSLAVTSLNGREAVVILDARKRLLVQPLHRGRGGASLSSYDLRDALPRSDNPSSVGGSRWGIAISGVMTGATTIASTYDLRRWHLWRDTTSSPFGFVTGSFLYALSNTSRVVTHPTQRLVFRAFQYRRAFEIIDLQAATVKRVSIDSTAEAPARLRSAEDGSVRLTWSRNAKRHFVSVTATDSLIAALDCDCSLGAPPQQRSTTIWLFRWDGEAVARLSSPLTVKSVTLTSDGSLIAAMQLGEHNQLVRWKLAEFIGSTPPAKKVSQAQNPPSQ